MIRKLFVILSLVVAVAVAKPCNFCGGYLSTGYGTGYVSGLNSNVCGNVCPNRVLTAGCTFPAVSAYPVGSPIATPAIVSPFNPTAATPVVPIGVIRSGLYGSTAFGGCRTGLLSYY